VARGVLTERHTDIGSRWAMMDSSWITPDGKLSFVKGCYRFLYDEDDDVAKRVQHINGDTVDLPEGTHIVKKVHGISCNYSDWKAALVCKPFSGAKLHKFFQATKTGPYRFTVFTNKDDVLSDKVKNRYTTWAKGRGSTASASSGPTEAQKELQESKKRTKTTAMESARKKAKDLNALKKEAKVSSA
ncbi:unnamed protein product, partial [Prorocentrum cordatum]